MKIWKWELEPVDQQIVPMPAGARILALQTQADKPCIWALCDPDAPLESREFHTYGTGHPMPDEPGDYVGTFQIHGGNFVFHVFEKTDT